MRSEISSFLKLLLTFVLAAAVAGCMSVRLVSDYDEQIDQGLTQLYADTSTFLDRMISLSGTPAGAYENNQQFYADAGGRLDALIARAQANQVLNNCPTTRVMGRILAAANMPAEMRERIGTMPEGGCEVVVLESLKRAMGNMRTFHQSQGANGIPAVARPIIMDGGLGAAFRAGIMIQVAKRGGSGSGGT